MSVKVNYVFESTEVEELYKNAKGNTNKVPAPFKKYDNDFAYDVVAASVKEIHKGVYEYGLGIAMQIDRESLHKVLQYNIFGKDMFSPFSGGRDADLEKELRVDIDFRPRSSVSETGLVLCNCEGTIDEGYINNIIARFYHVIPDLPPYKVGEKIGQIKLGFTLSCDFIQKDKLEPTERGLKGLGSTGK